MGSFNTGSWIEFQIKRFWIWLGWHEVAKNWQMDYKSYFCYDDFSFILMRRLCTSFMYKSTQSFLHANLDHIEKSEK
jgi:hypothetical protein